MKTDTEISEILGRITFPGFRFVLGRKDETRYLQIHCDDGKNTETGESLPWKGRKWMLSVHMTATEIVRTAYKAMLAAIEHEASELFRYRGQSIFNPHFDVDVLAETRIGHELDARGDKSCLIESPRVSIESSNE